MAEHIGLLIAGGVTDYYSGLALGVDQWASEIVLDMKKEHPNLRLIAVRPCETQANRWNDEQQERYHKTLALCDEVVTIQAHYTRAGIFKRNRYLVDHAGHLLAVYDGEPKGGAAYTIEYAKKQGRLITIIHPATMEVTSVLHNE